MRAKFFGVLFAIVAWGPGGVAKGDLIITTDADCEAGRNWLLEVISFYEEKRPKMIVGPVVLKGENSIQQIMQSQEMIMLTACKYASLYWNKPILCSGANLAFEKNAFIDVNGFDGAKELRVKMMESETVEEIETLVENFLKQK
jgi:GT2 family glycosyltransferase